MDSPRLSFNPSSTHAANMIYLGTGISGFRGQTLMMSMGDSPKKRPFFTTSSEELYDDEYYDELLPEKKRRLTPDQVVMLEKSFEEENKLEPERKTHLAKKLGLQPRQVAVWFQNRRARWKTKNLERDYDLLKSAYDSLFANYDTVSMENEKLKSEVLLLNETLQAREVDGPLKPGPFSDPNIGDPLPEDPAQQLNTRAEDLLSSGSAVGSAVVNEDVNPQLVDSGDSYFLGYPPPCVGAIHEAVHSEEDDGSDDRGSGYLCSMFGADGADDPNQGAEGWSWIWS